MTFAQKRIIRAILLGEMPKTTAETFNQLLDMFETPKLPAFSALYTEAAISIVWHDRLMGVIQQANIRAFFDDLANFADKHGRLDRILFGKTEAIIIAREDNHVSA